MSEAREAVVKLVAIALSLAVLRMLQRRQLPEPLRRRVLWGLAGLGALAYVNFGGFHTDGTVLHVWDQFHYAIGSKYFPELGYDGLYAATLAARGESHPELPPPARIRDLRDYRIVPSSELAPVAREVRARFSAPRWAAFVEDTARVSARDELFLDHGYLPTPAHVAIERVFSTPLAFRTRSLWLWALLDFGLLALAGLVVYRTLGLEALTASALVFGLGYCSRYYWIGGAFLRQDWLVALLLAAAALRRERWGWAGLALGYAAWVRVFPALFVVPLAVHALARFRSAPPEQRSRQLLAAQRFGRGLLASCALFLAGSCAGRGLRAWLECAARLSLHAREVLPNAIGLRVPFSASWANLRGDFIDPTTLYDYARVAEDFRRVGQAHLPLLLIAAVLLVTLSLRVAWRTSDPVVALASGVGVLFACVTPTGYYASFFVLLALVQPLRTARLLLLLNALAFLTAALAFALARWGIIRLNGAAVYVPVSVLLLIGLLQWLRTLLRETPGKHGA